MDLEKGTNKYLKFTRMNDYTKGIDIRSVVKMKRILTITIICVLIISLFSACDNTDRVEPSTAPTVEPEPITSEEPTVEPSEEPAVIREETPYRIVAGEKRIRGSQHNLCKNFAT